MSSTNRGYERHKTDFYVTPQWCIKDFLDAWLGDLQSGGTLHIAEHPDKYVWFDPCAGGDEKHGMSYPDVLNDAFGIATITNDIRPDSKADTKEDYLNTVFNGMDIIITNPPFYCAKEIIEKALQEVRGGGYVIMLLRLNFLGSKGRRQFFENNMPERIYVHNRRMSFSDDGKTDSIEYMHAVWRKDFKPEYSKLKII